MLVSVDLAVKAAAEQALAGGRVIDIGLLQLRLSHNRGVSFSVGDTLPSWVVLTGTGLISLALVVFAWRTAPAVGWAGRLGLAAVVAGAAANVADRGVDGVVTDYLHTGWFPTFNLADTFITVGAVLLVLDSLRRPHPSRQPGGVGAPETRKPRPDHPAPRLGGRLRDRHLNPSGDGPDCR